MRLPIRLACASILVLSAQAAFAQKLNVVTSIRPIQSLVENVSQGLADVNVLVPANASPHNYALKPSDAQNLQNADVIFWIDEHFESFLEKSIDTLPKNALKIAFAEQPGVLVLNSRELKLTADQEEHDDHAHEEEHSDHDDHEDHEDHEDHDEHTEEGGHTDHEGHDHGEHDLHIWLDPANAKTMTSIIAETLAARDPENAQTYKKNAAAFIAELDEKTNTIGDQLAPFSDKHFVTFHDAYQYFENSFEMKSAGVVTLSPETKPGAKRLKELKAALATNEISCIFSEPQFDAKLVDLAIEGTAVKSAQLDPLGANLEAGASFYIELLEQISNDMAACLGQAQ